MIRTKITLSTSELELAANASIILTKNTILQKTKELFEAIQQEMQAWMESNPKAYEESGSITPKISKGENYLGLPYLVLDYPRIFRGEDIFTIRTLFWWGHFFSCTLQLSGLYKIKYKSLLEDHYLQLKERDFYLGIHSDPWQHHFEEENYLPIKQMNQETFVRSLREAGHIKIAAKWPLENWQSAANELFTCWKYYLELLGLGS